MASKLKRNRTAREVVESCLRRRMCNADTLARVKELHPSSTMGLATVNYYRNQLRKRPGSKVPTENDARSR